LGGHNKEDEMGGECSTYGEKILLHACRLLKGHHEGKRQFVRPRNIWNNNTYNILKEIRWDGVDCIHRREDRDKWRALVKTVMNLWFHEIR
jgi:hypothetical protein